MECHANNPAAEKKVSGKTPNIIDANIKYLYMWCFHAVNIHNSIFCSTWHRCSLQFFLPFRVYPRWVFGLFGKHIHPHSNFTILQILAFLMIFFFIHSVLLNDIRFRMHFILTFFSTIAIIGRYWCLHPMGNLNLHFFFIRFGFCTESFCILVHANLLVHHQSFHPHLLSCHQSNELCIYRDR